MRSGKEKILIKLKNSINSSGNCEWRHLCYVDKDLLDSYLTNTNKTMVDMNKAIVDWYKQDFHKDLKLNTRKGMEELRNTIKGYYKERYPELYQESATDRQGWVRVWVTQKIKETISDGKSSN